MSEEDNSGIVYVLTNPAMPGLVKIGRTSKGISARLNQLYSTGVPVPFECEYAGLVSDQTKIERAFHKAFEPDRLNPSREFFQISPDRAITLLELMADKDVTPEVRRKADAVGPEANPAKQKLKARRQRFDFYEMGIQKNSVLFFAKDESQAIKVISNRAVELEGEKMSLSKATERVLGGKVSGGPGRYWKFENRTVSEIYTETYTYDGEI